MKLLNSYLLLVSKVLPIPTDIKEFNTPQRLWLVFSLFSTSIIPLLALWDILNPPCSQRFGNFSGCIGGMEYNVIPGLFILFIFMSVFVPYFLYQLGRLMSWMIKG
tara:strand:- start:53 stop:370 length:318 start_codon:yes stop_codon:yes gene_type:complete